jgi:hypothetical protein
LRRAEEADITRIATGDYDCINIEPIRSLRRYPISLCGTKERMLQAQIDEIAYGD